MAQEIEKDKFLGRLKKIYKFWEEEKHESISKVDAIIATLGTNDDAAYSKSLAIQTWLFGYELPDTLSVFTKNVVYFLSSKKKHDFLKSIENSSPSDGLPAINLLLRDKTDKDKSNFEKIIQSLKGSGKGKILGIFTKDKIGGEFIESWNEALKAEEFGTTDVSVAFGLIMAAKDESEIKLITSACDATTTLFNKYVKNQLIEIVDADKKQKHSRIADNIEKALQSKKYITTLDASQLEMCYPPIIQSGGQYSLKFSCVSDDSNLHFGAIICAMGIRYRQYCSNIIRTMLVDPSQELQGDYTILVDAEQKLMESLKPGAKLCDVYQAVVDFVSSAKPELLENMTKMIGFGMGIEFKESTLLINSKCTAVVENGMVFNINIGFGNIRNNAAKDESGKIAALFIGDTVVVNEDGAVSLTEAAKKRVKSICMFFKNEEEAEKDDNNKENVDKALGRGHRSVVLQDQLRKKPTGEEKRSVHQRELAEQLNRNARDRMAQAKDDVDDKKIKKSNVSYKSPASMPNEKEVRSVQVYVDKKYETVILPIFGVAVPFHISMIKNIAQSVEGDFTYLRINFFHPGATVAKDSTFPRPDVTFAKEITYRSSNLKEPGELYAPSSNLNTAFRLIKDVQKKFKTREAEEREKEGIVKQDKLLLSQNKANPRLKDLYIRPNIVSKKLSGSLEAHANGFRYTSIRGDKLDILYNNIKHAFFQPCDKEMIILLHFHLRNAILFGKRKHVDIQFFTEVGEITTDLGKHTHMHDRDDLYAEQAERELRHKLNTAFKSFCEKVEQLTKQELEYDTPFRDLGFFGVPHRSSVLLQPTSCCLVNLTDWPPFVVTLEEVELVHFERVHFSLKNFDMVFIFKDYTKKPAVVTAVEMKTLDHVKEWLDSCDIRYTEGIQSLNWPKIMKTILDDPEGFFDNGGWNFLGNESDEERPGDGEDDDSDEDDEAFEPTDESADSEDESEEEYSSEPTSESGDESDDDDDGSSGEESGKSWSELEEEARKADKEKTIFDEDDAAAARSLADKKRKGGKAAPSRPPASKKRR